MAKKLVVMAHGVGDAKEDFADAWGDILLENHGRNRFEVAGLWWEDVLGKVETKYPLISQDLLNAAGNFERAAEGLALNKLKATLDNQNYQIAKDHFMDALIYTALGDMRQYLADECALRLKKLTRNRAADTILIGHSLGATMLSHIVWMEFKELGGVIPYSAMILLAPPLAFESPLPAVFDDFLTIMGKIRGGGRLEVLKRFAQEWQMVGPGRLHLVINQDDVICSDVRIGGVDLIPVRQGFNAEEKLVLTGNNPGCIAEFANPDADPLDVAGNHAAENYLNSETFKQIFARLIA